MTAHIIYKNQEELYLNRFSCELFKYLYEQGGGWCSVRDISAKVKMEPYYIEIKIDSLVMKGIVEKRNNCYRVPVTDIEKVKFYIIKEASIFERTIVDNNE